MTPLLQLQTDVYEMVRAIEDLAYVNTVLLRRVLTGQEILNEQLTLTARNGRTGAGIVIEMPVVGVRQPNAPGPQADATISLLVLEQPELNLDASGGTQVTAEEIALTLLQSLHHWHLQGLGSLFALGNAIEPMNEFEGHVGYRVTLGVQFAQDQLARVEPPVITWDTGVVTITCATVGASVYYTKDESFPTTTTALYGAPFTVTVDTVVRACAYLTGSLPSHVNRAEVDVA